MTEKNVSRAAGLLGLVCAGLAASADVVTNDYFGDITSPTTLRGVTNIIAKCAPVNISADLTLDGRTFLWLRGESANSPAWVNLAPTANPVTLTVQGNSGFCAQNQRRRHFGLGTATAVDRVVVRWPSGKMQEIAHPSVNQVHVLREPA